MTLGICGFMRVFLARTISYKWGVIDVPMCVCIVVYIQNSNKYHKALFLFVVVVVIVMIIMTAHGNRL